MPFTSHDDYFKSVPSQALPLLKLIQEKVEVLLPEAVRCVSYNMPAFKDKRVFFYFAAFKNHIGIYPPVTNDTALLREIAPYRGAKGNLSFPLNQSLPVDLIGRVAVALHREYASKIVITC